MCECALFWRLLSHETMDLSPSIIRVRVRAFSAFFEDDDKRSTSASDDDDDDEGHSSDPKGRHY
jgi:hypothetical protein